MSILLISGAGCPVAKWSWNKSTAHSGDWSLLESTEVDSMVAFALSGVQGAVLYQTVLEGHNLAEVDIEPIFPSKFRSAQASANGQADHDHAITAYPTPADQEVWITFPAVLAGTGFRVLDAQGRLVFSHHLAGQQALMGLGVRPWSEGPYLPRALRQGEVLGETKCATVG